MTTGRLFHELKSRDYEVEEIRVNKNGKLLEGVKVITGNHVDPVFYPQDVSDIDEVLEILESNHVRKILSDPVIGLGFVGPSLDNIMIGLCKGVDESVIHRKSINGYTAYIYVPLQYGSYKVTMDSMLDYDDETIWEAAKRNTFKHTAVFDLCSELGYENFGELYCVTNDSKYFGASAILDTERLQELANEIGFRKFVAFPSSIHEFLIKPYRDDDDLEFFTHMVAEINRDVVAAEEQLGDEVFILEV